MSDGDNGYEPRSRFVHTEGNYVELAPRELAERPPDVIAYRASVARAARRRDAGEIVIACGCGAELDVTPPAHSPRCPGPTIDPQVVDELVDAAAARALELLRTAAGALAEVGATDTAIALHFGNVCAAALQALAGDPDDDEEDEVE